MVHAFPKGIISEVNVISRPEFELAYNDVIVKKFGWLEGFYGISILGGYLIPNPLIDR